MKMDFDDLDDLDLSPLIAHNANFDISLIDSPSPEGSPEPEPLPQAQLRPISKRRGKKRSSRACASCRSRKVRCNIVAHGAPCSNCRHDEVDCVLPLSRRQRAAKERAEQQQEQLQEQHQTETTSASINTSGSAICCAPERQNLQLEMDQHPHHRQEKTTQLAPPHGVAITEHVLCEILPSHSASQIGSPALRPTLLPTSSSSAKKGGRTARRDIEAPLATAQIQSSMKRPKVFSPLPDHLTSTDISYLAARSAFTLPSEALQVALIHAYVEFVHPALPIIDLNDFLDTVKNGMGRKISLLLFQSIMLAAAEFVSERVLRIEYSGKSKREAVSAMADRVKLLYDFDTTTDRLTIIQSLLLFSRSLSTQQSLSTHKNSHHYLGLALSLSFSLGLHRNPSPTPTCLSLDQVTPVLSSFHLSTLRRKKLERRIWWSLYLQDKLLEIAGNGNSRLKEEDFDATMLELEDFDLREDDRGGESERDNLRERVWAQSFIEKVKLCQWGHVMASTQLHNIPHQQHMVVNNLQPSPTIHTSSRNFSSQTRFLNARQLVPSRPAFPTNRHEEKSNIGTRSRSHSYAISNTTSSISEDADIDQDMECLTPQNDHFHPGQNFALDPMITQKYGRDALTEEGTKDTMVLDAGAEGSMKDLGLVGIGVDGEYDDFWEYLKV